MNTFKRERWSKWDVVQMLSRELNLPMEHVTEVTPSQFFNRASPTRSLVHQEEQLGRGTSRWKGLGWRRRASALTETSERASLELSNRFFDQ